MPRPVQGVDPDGLASGPGPFSTGPMILFQAGSSALVRPGRTWEVRSSAGGRGGGGQWSPKTGGGGGREKGSIDRTGNQLL